MRKNYLVAVQQLFFVFLSFTNWAQDAIIVSGLVQSELGEPIPGATVFIKGIFIGTSTNRDGKFIIRPTLTDAPTVLSVSFVGYETRDVIVEQSVVFVDL